MRTATAFEGARQIASGPIAEVAVAVRHAGQVLVFDDATGGVIDLDLRGSAEEIAARYTPVEEPRGRGRPKLGVTAREVTLLPRHWDWLAAQRGGASAALRRLVDEARKADDGAERARRARERAYRFMSAMAGDLPGFEEASRALFAGDAQRLTAQMAAWPRDICAYVARLIV
ncbi:MAG TPA: DUF2239 family protein [Caulobacteraceae bacterium]